MPRDDLVLRRPQRPRTAVDGRARQRRSSVQMAKARIAQMRQLYGLDPTPSQSEREPAGSDREGSSPITREDDQDQTIPSRHQQSFADLPEHITHMQLSPSMSRDTSFRTDTQLANRSPSGGLGGRSITASMLTNLPSTTYVPLPPYSSCAYSFDIVYIDFVA